VTYIKMTVSTNWYAGGESACAECLQRDECDFEVGYETLRKITRQAEDHVIQTGHSVQVERAQFRVVNPVKPR
jgi:hypothetical protein